MSWPRPPVYSLPSEAFPGIINPNHIISGLCQKPGKASRAAAQVQYQATLHSLLPEQSCYIGTPLLIGHIILENIVDLPQNCCKLPCPHPSQRRRVSFPQPSPNHQTTKAPVRNSSGQAGKIRGFMRSFRSTSYISCRFRMDRDHLGKSSCPCARYRTLSGTYTVPCAYPV